MVDHYLYLLPLQAQVVNIADSLAKNPALKRGIDNDRPLQRPSVLSYSALLPRKNCYFLLQFRLKCAPYLLIGLF